MSALLEKILSKTRTKIGDFWFYSLFLFLAMRLADAINVFVGLWLVPKYIAPDELGALLPLTSFASLLALPASIFALTFTKEVNALVLRREFGTLKSLMRGVFIGIGIFLLVSIFLSYLFLPLFLRRIRIVNGSLGILIIASAFITCTSPVFMGALQALKKFKEYTILSVLGAPIRLLTMMATMPIRAISGYFVGQSAPCLLQIFGSVFYLRKELATKAQPYWASPTVRHLFKTFFLIGLYQGAVTFACLISQTILRQRLPDIDSAAYYMLTRFSDITTFLTTTLATVLFPFTAELADLGKDTRPLLAKASIALLLFSALLALPFTIYGKTILSYLPHGTEYASYAHYIPWLILINALSGILNFHATTEVSANRWGFLKWWIPFYLVYSVSMLFVTGHGYFNDYLPLIFKNLLTAINITSLDAFLWWATVCSLIAIFFCFLDWMRPPHQTKQASC